MATGLDANIPEIWTKDFLELYHNSIVMKDLVNKNYEGQIKAGGDTVHVNVAGDVTVSNYTREASVSYQTITTTKESMTISDARIFAFRMDVLDVAQLSVDMFAKEREQGAKKTARAIDTTLLAHYANADAANVRGSTSAPISLTKDNIFDEFTEMGTLLNVANAVGMNRYAVVHPQIAKLIQLSPELRNRSTGIVDTNIQDGLMVKNFAGFEVHVTTNMATVSSTYPLMFFTEEYISFAEQVQDLVYIEKMETYAGPGMRNVTLFDSNVFTQVDGEGATLYAAA